MFSLSLRWKYIAGTTFIVLITIGIFSWQSLKLQEKQITAEDRERVKLITELINNSLKTTMLEGKGSSFHRKFLETLISEDLKQYIEEIRIFKEDGTIISSSIPSEEGSKIYKEDMNRFLYQSKPEVFSHVRNNKKVYSMVVPLLNAPACRRCHEDNEKYRGIIDVEISMQKTLDRIANSRRQMITFSVLTLIILSLSLGILTKFLINKPIDDIVKTMKRVEEGDLEARFRTKRTDEIGKLSTNLNSMLYELDNTRKEIEKLYYEEYQHIEKMATIGELAAAIAHEIKNPLAGISGAIQVFAEEFAPDDPKKEIIEDVIMEIERLDKAVRDLLNFARPPVPRPLSTNVKSMMERLLNVVQNQAESQNVSITLNIDENIGDIFLDPEQFQQVFLNIAINAMHSMPKGGALDISVNRRNDHIEFIFHDTGLGITNEEMKNLFKPFFTTKHFGTGLGLAICKNIIEHHGGSIEVESKAGSGSTFTVTIPIKDRTHE